MNRNCNKWSLNFPNVLKIFQMAIKYINIFFNVRPSKIYPNWDIWFENKPSGNPAVRYWQVVKFDIHWRENYRPAVQPENWQTHIRNIYTSQLIKNLPPKNFFVTSDRC
jgi:hypothetical protein